MSWVPDSVSPEAAAAGAGTRYKLRESESQPAVVLLVDDTEVYRHGEYVGVAQYAKERYNLSDEVLLALSRDYKDSVEREEYAV